MTLIIEPTGAVRCIYGEDIDLRTLGVLEIRRASHVEPEDGAGWRADLCPVGGPVLGPFPRRSEALEAEHRWLEANWLAREPSPTLGHVERRDNHRKETHMPTPASPPDRCEVCGRQPGTCQVDRFGRPDPCPGTPLGDLQRCDTCGL
jgi:hypothetical protein